MHLASTLKTSAIVVVIRGYPVVFNDVFVNLKGFFILLIIIKLQLCIIVRKCSEL